MAYLWEKYIKHISVSQLRTHERNPRRWVMEKLLKMPSCSSPATDIGKRAHDAFEDFIQGIQQGELRFKDEYDSITTHCLKALHKAMQEEPRLTDIDWYDVDTELEITYKIAEDLPPFLGYIDGFNHCFEGQDPMIIDYKTSRGRRYFLKDDDLAEDLQMCVYALRAMEMYPECSGVWVQHVQFAYGNKKDVVSIARNYINRAQLEKKRLEVENMIRHGIIKTIENFDKGGLGNVGNNCISNCCNAFGPNSCEYWPVCSGKATETDFREAFNSAPSCARQCVGEKIQERLTKNKECDSIKNIRKEDIDMSTELKTESTGIIHLEALVHKARNKFTSIQNIWDRRETMTTAVIDHIQKRGTGNEIISLPSHMREKISPEYEPIVTQLIELGYQIYVKI